MDDGVATISGEVDNALQHDLAIEIARGLEGVAEIVDRIEVREDDLDRLAKKDERRDTTPENARSPHAAAGGSAPDFATRVADATITASKLRLLWNRNTDGLDVSVSTQRGMVTLEGTVDSVASRELIGRIAANTRDVRAVDNRLRISPVSQHGRPDGGVDRPIVRTAAGRGGGGVTDTWITTKVAVRLASSDDVDSAAIEIRTRRGVVELRGLVASEYERERAPRIAADVYGVREIVNRLRVGRLALLGR